MGIGVSFLILNFLISLLVSAQIKRMLEDYYPHIWAALGYKNILDNSARTSLKLSQIIYHPPTEITHRPLRWLFTVSKCLLILQILVFAGLVFCIALGRTH